MKRSGGILSFLIIMFSSLASAGPVDGVEQLANGAREIITIITQFISDILLDIDSFDELLFAKILILLIVFFVVYTVLKRNNIFGSDKKISIIIAASISILAVRYLPTEFIEVILLQYSALAVGLTTLLPLVIFFFFLHQSGFGNRGRQIGWIFYGAALIGLTGFRYNDLGSASYIYYAGIFAVVISVLLDKQIHAQFLGLESEAMSKQRYLIQLMELRRRMEVMEGDINSNRLSPHEKKKAEKIFKKMKDQEKELEKKAN